MTWHSGCSDRTGSFIATGILLMVRSWLEWTIFSDVDQ